MCVCVGINYGGTHRDPERLRVTHDGIDHAQQEEYDEETEKARVGAVLFLLYVVQEEPKLGQRSSGGAVRKVANAAVDRGIFLCMNQGVALQLAHDSYHSQASHVDLRSALHAASGRRADTRGRDEYKVGPSFWDGWTDGS